MNEKRETNENQGASWGKRIAYGAVAVVALGALWYFGRDIRDYLGQFSEWIEQLGVWGPVVYILAYAVGTVALVPGLLLTMIAGVLFGLLWGTVYVLIGASLGACAAFLVSRYGARGFVEKRLEGNPKFSAIDRAVGKEGMKIVFLLRLSPAIPFNVLNYLLGLTKVRFAHYAIACLGMLPGTFLYVYYGKLVGDVAAIIAGDRPEQGVGGWVLLGLGVVATIAVTVLITRKARAVLKRETDLGADSAEANGDDDE